MKQGLEIYGGYAGFGAPDPDARDTDIYETILSGDLNGDDPLTADNAFHVLTAMSVGLTLDGLIIEAGHAFGDLARSDDEGGGLYADKANIFVFDCVFRNNTAARRGGAVTTEGQGVLLTAPKFTQCDFVDNTVAGNIGGGGAVAANQTSPDFTDCRFDGNRGWRGGALNFEFFGVAGDVEITDCTFIGNRGIVAGGAIHSDAGQYFDESPAPEGTFFDVRSCASGGPISSETEPRISMPTGVRSTCRGGRRASRTAGSTATSRTGRAAPFT